MSKAKKIKEIPFISVEQMIEVDRLMIEDYGISLIQMMENAGRNITEIIIHNSSLNTNTTNVLVMSGSGGNGGGAMVAARHLSNKGFNVEVVLSTKIENLKGVIKHQADILTKLPVKIYEEVLPSKTYDIIIDGVIGYSLKGEPRGFAKEMIEFCNMSDSTVVSLDSPSGLNLEGEITNINIVKADYTITLALPKVGLNSDKAKEYIGKLFLADISVPPSLYLLLELRGIKVPANIFKGNYWIELF